MSGAPRSIMVLNGANAAAVEMRPLVNALSPYGRVFAPNLVGHGGRPLPERLTMRLIAEDLLAELDRRGLARVVVVGYSLGGLIGLYLARHWPQRIAGVCCIATKFRIDDAVAERWVYLGDPDRIARPGNRRAQDLAQMHQPEDWRRVTLMNNDWYRDLAKHPPLSDEELRALAVPTALFSADQDPVVTPAEQGGLATLLRCRAVVYPGVMHPVGLAPLIMPVDIGNWIGALPG